MFEIKKFDLGSVALISAILFFIISLVIAVPMFLFTISLGASNLGPSSAFSLLFIFFIPIFYTAIGTVMNVILAALYNFIANKWHGLRFQLVKVRSLVNNVAQTENV